MLFANELGFSVSFVTAVGGSGKSYWLTKRIAERQLPDTDAVVVTNLPLNLEELLDYAGVRAKKPAAELSDRVVLLPGDMLGRWRDGRGGPWDLVGEGLDPRGRVFILDEVHNFCPAENKKNHEQWTRWLGEARHEGWAQLIFVSQDESKVGKPIKAHSAYRYELVNAETWRDPFFQAPLTHWYELQAAFITGEYRAKTAVIEYRKTALGKYARGHVEWFALDPVIFPLYRSYEAGGGGSVSGGIEAPKREFQKRTKVGLLWWFVRLNALYIARNVGIVALLLWVLFGGGARVSIDGLLGWINGVTRQVMGTPSPAPESVDIGPPGSIEARPAPVPSTLDDWKLVNAHLAAELSEAKTELEALRAEVPGLRERVADIDTAESHGFVLAMVGERTATFSNGETYELGQRIDWGPYATRHLTGVDNATGRALLSGGLLLRIGVAGSQAIGNPGPAPVRSPVVQGPQPTVAPPEGDRPQVQRPVSTANGGSQPSGSGAGERGAVDADGEGPALKSVLKRGVGAGPR